MLMLIDTSDPRYRPDPPPKPRPGWRPNLRLWLPVAAGVVCLLLAGSVPPVAGYVLAFAALGLFIDGVTSLVPRGDGLAKHRQ